MRLRSRLAMTAVGTLVVALFWYDAAAKHCVAKERLVEFVNSRLPITRELCEAAPEHWGVVHGGNPPPRNRPPIRARLNEGGRRAPPPQPDGFSSNEPPPGPPPPRAEPAVLFAYNDDLMPRPTKFVPHCCSVHRWFNPRTRVHTRARTIVVQHGASLGIPENRNAILVGTLCAEGGALRGIIP